MHLWARLAVTMDSVGERILDESSVSLEPVAMQHFAPVHPDDLTRELVHADGCSGRRHLESESS